MIKPKVETEKYGPNNPEPVDMKDSARVRNESHNALHASIEYIDAGTSSCQQDEPSSNPNMPCKNSLPT